MSFTIGCDPELICRRNGQFVPAHNFFKSNSSFGLDGCESTAELRPGFSESPVDLTSKIYQILNYGHDKAPELEFYAGHFVNDYAIGGHIHFATEPDGEVIDALDIVLGSLSNCIDDKCRDKNVNDLVMARKVRTEERVMVLNTAHPVHFCFHLL